MSGIALSGLATFLSETPAGYADRVERVRERSFSRRAYRDERDVALGIAQQGQHGLSQVREPFGAGAGGCHNRLLSASHTADDVGIGPPTQPVRSSPGSLESRATASAPSVLAVVLAMAGTEPPSIAVFMVGAEPPGGAPVE